MHNVSPLRTTPLAVPYAGRVTGPEELANLHAAADEMWLTEGRWCARLESALSRYLNRRFCRLTNSGSSANLLAVSALQLKAADEVITVACGFPTTVAPIIQCRGIPVFVDVLADTANVDVTQLEDARSDRTVAVMFAHTLGNPWDVAAVKAFCRKYGLRLIEDNCDALGSRYDGQLTGTFGDMATSSFYPAHHITTGEGGAVYTNGEQFDALIASYRDWGRDCYCRSGKQNTCGQRFSQQWGTLPFSYDHKYVYGVLGFHLSMTDLQASIGVAQLDKLEAFGKARRKNWAFLRNNLGRFSSVLEFQSATFLSDPSWFGFLITVKEDAGFTRSELVAHLEAAHIQTRPLFAGNVTRQPCFDALTEGVDYRIVGDLTNTDRFMRDAFLIGCFPGLKQEQLDYVVETFMDFDGLKAAA